MTSFRRYRSLNRDSQDYVERFLWGEVEYVDGAGAVMKGSRGTGTTDDDTPLLNLGYGFNLPANYNTETFALSLGSDTNQKYLLTSIPRDKQRPWPESAGGIQSPVDAARYIEINPDEIHLKDGTFVLGNNREVRITVSEGETTITVNRLVINADVQINGTLLRHNDRNVGSDHVHTNVDPGPGVSGPPRA